MHHSNQVAVSAVELVVAQVVELARLLRLLAHLREQAVVEGDDGGRLLALPRLRVEDRVARVAVRLAAALRARRVAAHRQDTSPARCGTIGASSPMSATSHKCFNRLFLSIAMCRRRRKEISNRGKIGEATLPVACFLLAQAFN